MRREEAGYMATSEDDAIVVVVVAGEVKFALDSPSQSMRVELD
jgi:hypothetical protein